MCNIQWEILRNLAENLFVNYEIITFLNPINLSRTLVRKTSKKILDYVSIKFVKLQARTIAFLRNSEGFFLSILAAIKRMPKQIIGLLLVTIS